MERIRVMLVEDELTTLHTIEAYLSEEHYIEIVAMATNGREALELLPKVMPDVIVLDIVMPVLDGFAVLEKMEKMCLPKPPKVVVLTTLVGDRFIMRALELGVYYYMCKPCDLDLLYRRIVESLEYTPRSLLPEPVRGGGLPSDDIGALLDKQGLSSCMKGYNYLHSAIQLGLSIDHLSGRITKELYPEVARLHGTTKERVERSIRHMIEKGWTSGCIQSSNAFPVQKRPSNGEYIAKMVKLLSAHQRPTNSNRGRIIN